MAHNLWIGREPLQVCPSFLQPKMLYYMIQVIALHTYVTGFAKRGLIHATNSSTLRIVTQLLLDLRTALKFGSRTFLSLY